MVPQGVTPPAQLLSMPVTRVPVGSSLVFIRSAPAAGPRISIGVVAVTRRLYRESRTTSHSPASVRRISTIDRPWASNSTSTVSWVGFVKNSGTSGGASSDAGGWYSGLAVR